HAAGGDQAAQPDAPSFRHLLRRDVLGQMKAHHGIAQREQHEEGGKAQDADPQADEGGATLATGHEPRPNFAARPERSESARASPSKLRRASARAARASSRRPSTV